MGRLVTTLLVLCLIPLTMCSPAAALRAHDDLRRGLEQAMRGRFLADTAAGGSVVPVYCSKDYYNVANFTIGTPPQPASAIIDIAGELVWTQCSVCQRCFKQELPLFVPNASSSFQPEPCGGDFCKSIPTRNCSSKVCIYEGPPTQLGGNTFGFVGRDNFSIGTTTASLGFGCVVASDIDTMDGPSGFIGLGRTPWSLVSQMELTKFSYCLSPHGTGKSSRLFLGSSAKLTTGGNSISTPFVKTSPKDDRSQYYLLNLEGIKAGDTAIATPQSSGTVLMMHTVTPFTFLADSAYQALKKAVTKATGAAPTATPLPPLDLCFPKAGFISASAPDLVFTFHGAASLTVPSNKYLIEVGKEKDTVCMAILSMAGLNMTGVEGLSILGTLQQENVHFVFDLEEGTLSFEQADCSSLS